jgi:hypothetical protein
MKVSGRAPERKKLIVVSFSVVDGVDKHRIAPSQTHKEMVLGIELFWHSLAASGGHDSTTAPHKHQTALHASIMSGQPAPSPVL